MKYLLLCAMLLFTACQEIPDSAKTTEDSEETSETSNNTKPTPTPPSPTQSTPTPQKAFTVFSNNKCYDELDMAALGVKKNILITENGFFGAEDDHKSGANLTQAKKMYDKYKTLGLPIVIDIESWGYSTNTATQQKKYLDVLDIFQNVNVGYYGEMPIRNYWGPIRHFKSPTNATYKAAYEKWQEQNNFFAPVAKKVSAFYPSLYTFYEAPSDWVIYANSMVSELRRIAPEKPVYPYLWPRLHTDTTKFISGSLWKIELETLYSSSDGLVIWNISSENCNELRDSPLWDETVKFLRKIK